ncbi:MAG: PF20097 family protein [Phycisphaerales bacterium JB063]
MTTPHDKVRCPGCRAVMQDGYLPVNDGLVFVRGDGKAAGSFAEDIPGTHAVMRSNRLFAWRCKACHLVLFKYGRDNAKHVERIAALNEDESPADHEAETDAGNTGA